MRVNFYGGPGSGKSTTTARVFAQLKERQVSVEHVSEYVKAWAYAHRTIRPFDQVYLFAKQHQYEYRFIASGVRNIVTDSPCFQAVAYAPAAMRAPIGELCRLYDEEHPCVNIFIRRGDKPYVQEGRYQSYAEARQMDDQIFTLLTDHYQGRVVEHEFSDQDGILRTVMAHVD